MNEGMNISKAKIELLNIIVNLPLALLQMYLQSNFLCITFITGRALVWSLASMHTFMDLHVPLVRERLITEPALERSFSSV